MKRNLYLLFPLLLFLAACNGSGIEYDASGSFETEETIISSEVTGVVKQFSVSEGQTLTKGMQLGYIDSVQLYLKKIQLEAQIKAVLSKQPNINKQLASLKEQLKSAERDQRRISNLMKADAATQKQYDDVTTQIEVLQKQIDAQESTLDISTESIRQETAPLRIQIDQLNDQLQKCRLINPVNGTVLNKYIETNELVTPGKPLYKIADLNTMKLRAYVTGDQLSRLKINQKVKVYTDDGAEGYKQYDGTVSWISSKAEFTPKTIQTKNERANLVYAVKIDVQNDGLIKIGMYGEVKF